MRIKRGKAVAVIDQDILTVTVSQFFGNNYNAGIGSMNGSARWAGPVYAAVIRAVAVIRITCRDLPVAGWVSKLTGAGL